MADLFDNVWGEKKTVLYDNTLDLTLPVSAVRTSLYLPRLTPGKIALFVIAVAGFGRNVSWQSDLVAPSGHKLAFKVNWTSLCVGTPRNNVLTGCVACGLPGSVHQDCHS